MFYRICKSPAIAANSVEFKPLNYTSLQQGLLIMWAWGDFFWPLIVTRSNEIKTLPLLLQSFQGEYGSKWHLLMAASVMGLLPMVVVFLLGQRQFIEGIKLGAVKG